MNNGSIQVEKFLQAHDLSLFLKFYSDEGYHQSNQNVNF